MAVAEMMSASGAVAQEPLTVLIVDDDADVAQGLAEFLEEEGFAVVTAGDGRAALDQLRSGLRPCAILLDLMMPRMNGWQFRREQLQDHELREIPVVVISAARLDDATTAQLGQVDLIPKPPPMERLLAAVRRHCGGSVQ